jgi:SlyX protein
MNSEPLEQIETKIAFLEHANAELSDVVTRQQRDIDGLRDQIAALATRIQALHESAASPRTAEEERPPHY